MSLLIHLEIMSLVLDALSSNVISINKYFLQKEKFFGGGQGDSIFFNVIVFQNPLRGSQLCRGEGACVTQ